jgi:hypothetical protein
MTSGTNVAAAVSQAAVGYWQGWRRQAPIDQPVEPTPDHMLADAVLGRADPTSAREQVHYDILRMMQRFGIDPEQVPSEYWHALRDAERVCAHCLVVSRCQRWLYGQLSEDAPRSFCPSAALYEKIAVAQQQARASDEPLTA